MIDLTVMAKTNENETPGCAGCGYLIEHDWTCDHIGYTGRSRVAIGAKNVPRRRLPGKETRRFT